MEQPHGVGAAADAGDQRIRQAAFGLLHLLARLVADHALEVAHHRRDRDAGRRPCRCSRTCRATLVTQSRSASFIASLSVREPDSTGTHLGAEHLHAEHVRLLPLDVDRAHVDDAFEAEACAHSVAVATPCWPAPVSAMMRGLPMRSASMIWPSTLFTLCAPVWLSSSRLK